MLTDQSLIISPDKSELLIKIEPQESDVNALEITQLIARSELSELFHVEDNIIKAVDLINLATKEAALSVENKSSQNRESTIVVARQVDAKLTIEFSDDEMQAYAVITAAYSGEIVSFSDLMIILSQHNLTQSLHEEGLDEFLESASLAAPGETTRYHIISGTPPIDGEDSRFEYLVDTMEQRILKPKQTKHGKVNMKELGDILTVKVGAELIRRHPPTDGVPGLTVLGEPIASTPGQSHDFKIGEGTEISSTDKNLLVANRVGMPRALEEGLAIDDVLVIENVDVGHGNVRFEGSVMISGDVCEGMTVVSEGSITVGGSVNSATLEAKGNILVQNGIIGKKGKSEKVEYSCMISSGGSVNAKFIQYSKVKAALDIVAQTHVLHCNIVSGANVTVSNATGSKGTLFGGSIVAGEKISAVELGGTSGSRTELIIKGALPELRKKNSELNKLLQQEHKLLKQLLAAHEKVGQLEQGKKKQQLLHQLKRNVDKKIDSVVAIQDKKAANERAIKSFLANASINSMRNLQHGVLLEIDGKKLTTKQEYKTTAIKIDGGRLLIAPVTH